MMRTRLLILPALALALAACGGSKKNDEAAATSTPAATESATPTATATPASTPAASGKKPVVHVPKGKPPTKLVVKDLKTGTGATAETGRTVTVQYVGVDFKGGKQFDASWDRGQPFSFPLGQGQVIPGWDKGVVGMKVGGRRELVIPPDLGYGPQGSPPVIKPNETLVFVIDLLNVQ